MLRNILALGLMSTFYHHDIVMLWKKADLIRLACIAVFLQWFKHVIRIKCDVYSICRRVLFEGVA